MYPRQVLFCMSAKIPAQATAWRVFGECQFVLASFANCARRVGGGLSCTQPPPERPICWRPPWVSIYVMAPGCNGYANWRFIRGRKSCLGYAVHRVRSGKGQFPQRGSFSLMNGCRGGITRPSGRLAGCQPGYTCLLPRPKIDLGQKSDLGRAGKSKGGGPV